jgi:general stress protein YciG
MKVKGFALMSPEKRKEIARKGGLTISQNKQHMSDIGRKGGQTSRKIRVEMVDNKHSINSAENEDTGSM